MEGSLSTIRPELLSMTPEQFQAILPLAWLVAGSLLATLTATLSSSTGKWLTFLLVLASLAISGASAVPFLTDAPVKLFGGMMVMDPFAAFFHLIFVACALFTVLSSMRYLDRETLPGPEYGVLILFATMGMSLLAATLDFVSLFISLELMSLSVYLLVGYRRADRRSNEAALKYFILGGAASALLLYGGAILYGATGTIKIQEIAALAISDARTASPLYALGAGLVLVGFLFKIASVPFHMWMPDVYEGAPAPITGFMTTALKAASFAALIRVLSSLGYGHGLSAPIQESLRQILWVSAVLTMTIGNLIALTQKNLKRMLAYSSISHTGYLLVGILCFAKGQMTTGPVILYLVSYCIMNLGAFAVLTLLSGKSDQGLQLQDIAGLSRTRPWLSFAFSLFLLSMAGIPPTAGFAAKYSLFYGAVQAGETPLVVISVLCSLVSVYYYLRVIVQLYMRDPVTGSVSVRVSRLAGLALAVAIILTLQVGIQPESWIRATQKLLGSI